MRLDAPKFYGGKVDLACFDKECNVSVRWTKYFKTGEESSVFHIYSFDITETSRMHLVEHGFLFPFLSGTPPVGVEAVKGEERRRAQLVLDVAILYVF